MSEVPEGLYADEFKLSTPVMVRSTPHSRPSKLQKVDAASPAVGATSVASEARGELFSDKDPACCISLSVSLTTSEADVRKRFAGADVSFVSFETDAVSGASLGRCFVCFSNKEDADRAKAESGVESVSKRDFEQLMDRLNLRRSSRRSKSTERKSSKERKSKERKSSDRKSRDRRRSRSRSRSRDRKRERDRGKRR